MFMGPPTTVYYNFRNAMMDEKTNLIFYLFIIIAQVCFYFEIRRIKWKNKKSMNYNISQPSRIYNKIVNYRYFFVTRILCTIGVALLNQKRTTVMLILGFCLVIDIAFKNKNLKKTMIKYIPAIILVAIYFWAYALITEKISYNQDWYYVINEYFFRNIHTKFSIYAELYPNKVHILDYPCQAILCDFLFFFPRSLWLAKPHNYPYYFIAGLLNYGNITEKTWIMPTSYYPEFVSNYDDMLKILAMIVLAMIILQKCSFNGKRIL